jgi:hypothetical protein
MEEYRGDLKFLLWRSDQSDELFDALFRIARKFLVALEFYYGVDHLVLCEKTLIFLHLVCLYRFDCCDGSSDLLRRMLKSLTKDHGSLFRSCDEASLQHLVKAVSYFFGEVSILYGDEMLMPGSIFYACLAEIAEIGVLLRVREAPSGLDRWSWVRLFLTAGELVDERCLPGPGSISNFSVVAHFPDGNLCEQVLRAPHWLPCESRWQNAAAKEFIRYLAQICRLFYDVVRRDYIITVLLEIAKCIDDADKSETYCPWNQLIVLGAVHGNHDWNDLDCLLRVRFPGETHIQDWTLWGCLSYEGVVERTIIGMSNLCSELLHTLLDSRPSRHGNVITAASSSDLGSFSICLIPFRVAADVNEHDHVNLHDQFKCCRGTLLGFLNQLHRRSIACSEFKSSFKAAHKACAAEFNKVWGQIEHNYEVSEVCEPEVPLQEYTCP